MRVYAVGNDSNSESSQVDYAIQHMEHNKAFQYAILDADQSQALETLSEFRRRYQNYRHSWRNRIDEFRSHNKRHDREATPHHELPPLCVDIEVAAVCDLACPFCYRQHTATPDKLIDPTFCEDLIDQCSALGVPSIKFNWRGEPLLNSNLAKYIDRAKKGGVLETIINTNATRLTERVSQALINAGLDKMIYSFDGGSKETYEKMRPGRFGENRFDEVVGNIRQFHHIRKELNAMFPRTKIQMILTEETRPEQEDFVELFREIVDEVVVKKYSERGGNISELTEEERRFLRSSYPDQDIQNSARFLHVDDDTYMVADGRLPCEQPFQRLLVTYDGKIGMCCYDWGAQHPVGYASQEAIQLGDSEYKNVLRKAKAGRKGYEQISEAKMPRQFNRPESRVETLEKIWFGSNINKVRSRHLAGKLEELEICRSCPFSDTYSWRKLTRPCVHSASI